ncbi:MAG: hypothetical protein GY852_11290 [bacterium]|nr:hypothetical protein [bacterium]
MNSIWGKDGNGKNEDFTGQVRTALGNGNDGPVEAYRTSKPPLNEGERAVYQIFDKLRSKSYNLIEKRRMAEAVLRGEYGIRHEVHAKLLLGPTDLQEIIESPVDIVLPILELMNDRELRMREKIAAVLAVRGDERAIDAMCAKLDAKNYSERYNFGMALGKIAGRSSDVDALQKLYSEIEKRRENTEEFSSAWGYVRVRLRELGAVVPKPEIKRMPKPRGGSVPGNADGVIPLVLKK